MNKFASYSRPLIWFIAALLPAFVAGCGGGDNGKGSILGAAGAVATVVRPTVTATVPLATTPIVTGVAIGSKVTATFSKDMAAATVTSPTSTFTLACPTGTAVAGTVTYVATSRIATFSPTASLPASTTCTGTITTGAQDTTGAALANAFVWSFTTGVTVDTTAPFVSSTGALNGATGLPINRDSTATFNEPMDPATLSSPATSFTVRETVSGNAVAGVVTYLGNTATFNPDSNLLPNTQYTSTVSTAARDLAGNALVAGLLPNPWSWTTGATPDTTAPTVTVTVPANVATNVPVNQTVNATFSEEMKQATMITTNFTVKETVSGNNVPGTVAYDVQSNIATFLLSPGTNLTANTDYTATVTNGAQDLAGNALVVPAGGPPPNPWTFRTAAAVVPLAVNLGRAASFGLASTAAFTSTGVTVVNGDIAISPSNVCTDSTGNLGTSQSCALKAYGVHLTGMSVNGSIFFAGDPHDNGVTANAIKNDLNSAWVEGKNKQTNNGAAATTVDGFLGGNISGKTIFPGVYGEGSTLFLDNGATATFDALGDPNAIFIIKVGSSLTSSSTLATPSQIRRQGGALARNIWFIVSVDATIGIGTKWEGNILAGQSVTVNDSATVNGRVLGGANPALNGAISLVGAPAAGIPPASAIVIAVPPQ